MDIWIGAVPFSRHVPLLKTLGISGVVTLTERFETLVETSTYEQHGIENLWIPTTDYLFAPSDSNIGRALAFINKHAIQGGSTLVHCKAGRARSATIVLCYLIKYKNMTPEAALARAKAIRKRVKLATAQLEAVNDFATRLSTETSSMENSGEGSIRDSDPEVHQECAFDENVVLSEWFGRSQSKHGLPDA